MEVLANIAPEREIAKNGIHFEPGNHPPINDEYSRLIAAFNHGYLNAFLWNKETGERIVSYAYNAPALLLTIDGIPPQPPSLHPRIPTAQEARNTWIGLPARPSKLQRTHSVYVVKGDTDYYNLPQAVLSTVSEPEALAQQMNDRSIAESNHFETLTTEVMLGETAVIAGIGLALWGVTKGIAPSLPEQKLSRRRLLNKAFTVAAGTAIVGNLLRYDLPIMTPAVPDEPTKEFLQMVATIVRPRLVQSTFVDGRTALLLAKAEDAQASLAIPDQPENVVVMGDAHLDNAQIYMQNRPL